MVIAQATISMAAVFIKYFEKVNVPLMEALIVRAVLGVIVCFAACKLAGINNLSVPRNLLGLVILRGSIAGVGAACVFLGFRMLPTGDAMALNKLACITTLLLTWIMGWESINWIMWVGAIGTGIGGVVVAHPPLLFGGSEWTTNRLIGVSLALLSTIFFTLGGMSVGKIGTRMNTLVLGFWVQFGIFPVPMIFLSLSVPDVFVWPLSWAQIAHILAFAALILVGRIFELRSFQLCNGALGNTLGTIGIVFSYILGYFLLDEKVSIFAVVGSISIFLGVWVVAVGKNKCTAARASEEAEAKEDEGEEA